MIWTAETYRQYLLSEHWAETRLSAVGYRCGRCGATKGPRVVLDVHHRTYERIGREWPGDLEVICRTCHGAEHGIEPPPTPVSRRSDWEHVGSICTRIMARLTLTGSD